MKKTIFLLNINNYAPEITEITYPFIQAYAKKIGAEIVEITERKYPDMPPVFEKLQIHQLAKEIGSDWNIYIDSDALIHPDMFDVTELLDKSEVFQVGRDFSPIRFKKNVHMLRDGRNIGTCNWFTVFSDWCIDLFNPDIGMGYEDILNHCFPTQEESFVFDRKHLIDDYILATNVARYGFKHYNWPALLEKVQYTGGEFFYHEYLIPAEEKAIRLKEKADAWTKINFPAINVAQAVADRAKRDEIKEKSIKVEDLPVMSTPGSSKNTTVKDLTEKPKKEKQDKEEVAEPAETKE